MEGARAFYIAGVAATSDARRRPRAMTFPSPARWRTASSRPALREADAFEAYARLFPRTTLLVDTYDTLGGVREVIALAQEMGEDFDVRAIRLDSGDLDALVATGARAARRRRPRARRASSRAAASTKRASIG